MSFGGIEITAKTSIIGTAVETPPASLAPKQVRVGVNYGRKKSYITWLYFRIQDAAGRLTTERISSATREHAN